MAKPSYWIPSQYQESLSRYRYSHYKDKTVIRPSCFSYGRPWTDKMAFYIGTAPIYLNIVLVSGYFMCQPEIYAFNVAERPQKRDWYICFDSIKESTQYSIFISCSVWKFIWQIVYDFIIATSQPLKWVHRSVYITFKNLPAGYL